MKEDKLSELSMQLSVDVLNITKQLQAKHETTISNQLSRSATSVCANIAESKYGHSRADFIAKLEIALKEANETGKWLEMLLKSEYIDDVTFNAVNVDLSIVPAMLRRPTAAKRVSHSVESGMCHPAGQMPRCGD